VPWRKHCAFQRLFWYNLFCPHRSAIQQTLKTPKLTESDLHSDTTNCTKSDPCTWASTFAVFSMRNAHHHVITAQQNHTKNTRGATPTLHAGECRQTARGVQHLPEASEATHIHSFQPASRFIHLCPIPHPLCIYIDPFLVCLLQEYSVHSASPSWRRVQRKLSLCAPSCGWLVHAHMLAWFCVVVSVPVCRCKVSERASQCHSFFAARVLISPCPRVCSLLLWLDECQSLPSEVSPAMS
jgi:hypothetical protein